MHTIIGSCPKCGAPIYAPSNWMAIIPPPPVYSCSCHMATQPRVITTDNITQYEPTPAKYPTCVLKLPDPKLTPKVNKYLLPKDKRTIKKWLKAAGIDMKLDNPLLEQTLELIGKNEAFLKRNGK